MSLYSAPTPCERPVPPDPCARVSAAARRFGVADPLLGATRSLFLRTFARRATDPRYLDNQLQPGALPLEWSFSELDPDALRLELQPFDTERTPLDRRRDAAAELSELVRAHYGESRSLRFDSLVGEASANSGEGLRYGAFLGFALRPEAPPELKLYVELGPHSSCEFGKLPGGATPLFRSVAVGAGGVTERTYTSCRDGLRLLDLESVCAELALAHRFPAVLLTLLELTQSEFQLPPRSVLLAVRRDARDSELKVELVAGSALNPAGLVGRIERLLEPSALAPFRRWRHIVQGEAVDELAPSVVSVRVSAALPPRLSVYAAEPWSAS